MPNNDCLMSKFLFSNQVYKRISFLIAPEFLATVFIIRANEIRVVVSFEKFTGITATSHISNFAARIGIFYVIFQPAFYLSTITPTKYTLMTIWYEHSSSKRMCFQKLDQSSCAENLYFKLLTMTRFQVQNPPCKRWLWGPGP